MKNRALVLLSAFIILSFTFCRAENFPINFSTTPSSYRTLLNEKILSVFGNTHSRIKFSQTTSEKGIFTQTKIKPVDTLCYELRIYTAEKGKLNDLLKRFRNHTLALFEKHRIKVEGFWVPLDNPDEKLYYIVSYPNRKTREINWKAFIDDTTRVRIFKESEANGKLVHKVDEAFLKTTDFSPNKFTGISNQVWELRIYTASPNNLGILLSRFRDHTLKLFEKSGMTNKIYFTPTDEAQGSDKMLYYFLTHKSEAAAKESFKNFGASDEWKKVRTESEIKGGGSLTTKIESVFMYPTDFSPIK